MKYESGRRKEDLEAMWGFSSFILEIKRRSSNEFINSAL